MYMWIHSGVLVFLAALDLYLLTATVRAHRLGGPKWLWRMGPVDPVRNLFFRPDGDFRSWSRPALVLLLGSILLAIALLLWSIWA
jgi:hypothetical protein